MAVQGFDDWHRMEYAERVKRGADSNPSRPYTGNAAHIEDDAMEPFYKLEQMYAHLAALVRLAEGQEAVIKEAQKLILHAKRFAETHHIDWLKVSHRWKEAEATLEHYSRDVELR